jgi:indolepyruvate ferredoxin oxidoreductase beta subunit
MVMLGALIGSNLIPLDAAIIKNTIATSTRQEFLESNLKAFDLGVEAAHARTEGRDSLP